MKTNGSSGLPTKKTTREILDGGAVLEALRIGSRRAVRINKLLGLPVATSRDGKAVWIPASEIQLDGDVETDFPRGL